MPQRIRPGQVVASRRVTVTSSGKIKSRKNPKKDAIEKSVDKTPFGPLIGALDFGGKRKKAKKAKARKARNTRKRTNHRYDLARLQSQYDDLVDRYRFIERTKDLGYASTRKSLASLQKRIFKVMGQIDVAKAQNPKSSPRQSRFDRCVKSVTERGGSYDARAVCASAGRRKYGKKKFQAMAKAGKARAARKRNSISWDSERLLRVRRRGGPWKKMHSGIPDKVFEKAESDLFAQADRLRENDPDPNGGSVTVDGETFEYKLVRER